MKQITVSELTTEEKLRLICAEGFWYTVDLGGRLPTVCVSDGPAGLRAERTDVKGEKITVPAVAYPSVQSLANTWSEECAREMGACLADDCIERNVDSRREHQTPPAQRPQLRIFFGRSLFGGHFSQGVYRGTANQRRGRLLETFLLQ